MIAALARRKWLVALIGAIYLALAFFVVREFQIATSTAERQLSGLARGFYTILMQTEKQVVIFNHAIEDLLAPVPPPSALDRVRSLNNQLIHRATLFRQAPQLFTDREDFTQRFAGAVSRFEGTVSALSAAIDRYEPFSASHAEELRSLGQQLDFVTTFISTFGRDLLHKQSLGQARDLSLMSNVALGLIVIVLIGLVLLAAALVIALDTGKRLRRAKEDAEKALEDLKSAQDHLIRSEKMASLGNLVAGVAHEINTPVGVALTSAGVLSRKSREMQEAGTSGKVSRSAFERYLHDAVDSAELIERNTVRAAELIQSFKKVAVDQTSDERRLFPLGSYLREIMMSLGPELRRRRIAAHVEATLDIEIDSYPGALFQVISNMAMNAFNHAFANGDPGVIAIGGGLDGDHVTILFADDGAGMTEDVARRVFDPFFTTQRGAGGSGLGMHIAHNLVVQRLGGEISLETAPGAGASYCLRVPISAPEEPEDTPGQGNLAEAAP